MHPITITTLSGLSAVFFFGFCIPTGDAIVCYECNSHNDSRCAQEIPPDQFKKECSEHKEGNKYTICRKITQSIDFEVHGLKPDTRVIRTCGWEKSHYDGKCYQRSGFGGRQEVCSCLSDLCNSAENLNTPLTVIAIGTAIQLLATRLF